MDSTNTPALPELKPVCPLCKGTGHKEVGSFAVAGAKVSITCDICRGRGWLYLDAEELTALVVSTLQALSEACKERDELDRLINTPSTGDFLSSVELEAAHQVGRWASDHDAGKTDADWFWLIGYLAGKVLSAPNEEKKLHHVITTAAVCLNWHRHLTGEITEMRPGIEPPEAELTEARTLLANQAAGMRRLIDLVRHQRGELFAEQLISAEELAALVADSESGQRVARLESYDAMREKIKSQAAEIATLREKDA